MLFFWKLFWSKEKPPQKHFDQLVRFTQIWAKSGLGFVGGWKHGVPPKHPYVFAAICHMSMKIVLRKLGDIWSLGPPTLLKLCNFTSFYKRLNKKCCQNGNLCFTPFVFTGYGRFFSKKVLVNVLTLIFCQKFFF